MKQTIIENAAKIQATAEELQKWHGKADARARLDEILALAADSLAALNADQGVEAEGGDDPKDPPPGGPPTGP